MFSTSRFNKYNLSDKYLNKKNIIDFIKIQNLREWENRFDTSEV